MLLYNFVCLFVYRVANDRLAANYAYDNTTDPQTIYPDFEERDYITQSYDNESEYTEDYDQEELSDSDASDDASGTL